MSEPAGIFAKPFEFDALRWTTTLDRVCSHRPWFPDDIWYDEDKRRLSAATYIIDAIQKGRVWEAFKGAEIVGVILLDRLHLESDGRGHFIFFDRSLANKRQLCENILAYAFDPDGPLKLHTVRLEVPTYAHALASWATAKLGFRYEADELLERLPVKLARAIAPREGEPTRQAAWRETLRAELTTLLQDASRRRRTLRYRDAWHDVMLLRLTREEFNTQHASRLFQERHGTLGRQHSTISGTVSRTGTVPPAVPAEPERRWGPDTAEPPASASDAGLPTDPERSGDNHTPSE